ncbi:DUF4082 domain-containing protein [Poriferisphaera sp. WC338]|uniref:DUF4082 domain-containing protein n=1 Tax=Poriferisphaera sp. WC338 TaxID=3425129 RepID=UPI003D81AA48
MVKPARKRKVFRGKRSIATGAMMGAAALIGAKTTKAESVDTVLQDQISSGAHYSFTGSTIGVTVGWSFTANSPDLVITQLSTLTGASGNNDTITLWNTDTDEILAQVNSLADTDTWRTVALDEGISLDEGTNYGITLTSTAGGQYRRVLESFTEASTDGNISYTDSVYRSSSSSLSAPTSFSSLWDFPDVLGEFQWLVDFGYIDTNAPVDTIDTPVAAPTPTASGIGAIALGLISLRRKRNQNKPIKE